MRHSPLWRLPPGSRCVLPPTGGGIRRWRPHRGATGGVTAAAATARATPPGARRRSTGGRGSNGVGIWAAASSRPPPIATLPPPPVASMLRVAAPAGSWGEKRAAAGPAGPRVAKRRGPHRAAAAAAGAAPPPPRRGGTGAAGRRRHGQTRRSGTAPPHGHRLGHVHRLRPSPRALHDPQPRLGRARCRWWVWTAAAGRLSATPFLVCKPALAAPDARTCGYRVVEPPRGVGGRRWRRRPASPPILPPPAGTKTEQCRYRRRLAARGEGGREGGGRAHGADGRAG